MCKTKSGRFKNSKRNLDKQINKILSRSFQSGTDSVDLEGQEVKNIVPSNILDIYPRLDVLLGLKVSGHTNTLTEGSNLFDDLYKRGEIHKEQQYRTAPNSNNTQ